MESTLDVRKPEYTGENRCWPCTAVNLALLAAVVAILTVATAAAVGAAVAVVGLVGIWLRGYLVPGTPQFAPRLVAALPGGDALFGKERVSTGPDSLGGDADAPAGDDLLGVLVEAGVLEVDGETVVPAPSFDEAWHEEMARLRERETDALAQAVLAVSPASEVRTVSEGGDEWLALSDGDDHALEETWLSRPVAIAELAAVRATDGYLSDEATRRAAAQALRMFLAECPDCETPLEEGTDVPCCGGYNGPNEVPAETLVCPACEVRLYTFDEEPA